MCLRSKQKLNQIFALWSLSNNVLAQPVFFFAPVLDSNWSVFDLFAPTCSLSLPFWSGLKPKWQQMFYCWADSKVVQIFLLFFWSQKVNVMSSAASCIYKVISTLRIVVHLFCSIIFLRTQSFCSCWLLHQSFSSKLTPAEFWAHLLCFSAVIFIYLFICFSYFTWFCYKSLNLILHT